MWMFLANHQAHFRCSLLVSTWLHPQIDPIWMKQMKKWLKLSSFCSSHTSFPPKSSESPSLCGVKHGETHLHQALVVATRFDAFEDLAIPRGGTPIDVVVGEGKNRPVNEAWHCLSSTIHWTRMEMVHKASFWRSLWWNGCQLPWNGILSYIFHFNCCHASKIDALGVTSILFWKYTQHINTIQCMSIQEYLGVMQSHRLPLQETHVNQKQWRQWTARLGQMMFLWARKFHV